MSGDAKRIDVISDTHGYLSPSLRAELEGADLIIHAGDITSEANWAELQATAPIRAVLGNNDYFRDYGPEVDRVNVFSFEGLTFAVAHYEIDLPLGEVDVAVCGHTHRARCERRGDTLVLNPGSASYPRGRRGPTMARMYVRDGALVSVDLIDLDE